MVDLLAGLPICAPQACSRRGDAVHFDNGLLVLGAVVVDLAAVVRDVGAGGTGTVLAGSNLSPVPTHHVPEMTTIRRSFWWKCGRLMFPGSHFTRTM